ncbi:nuclear transport factor 2 family protein [Rheinheimera sp. FR7-31]|uniref:YybH family protein n=1 Tax=Rheinheimera fenheensis TaxID=3152295 RepID=UPI00325C4510
MFRNKIQTLSAISLGLALLSPVSALAHGNEKPATPALFVGESTAAAQTVTAFHQALRAGDAKAVRAMLADDVLIVEGNGVERSADEYASHHMLADMKFMAAVQAQALEHQTKVLGNVAYSVSRTQLTGDYKGKPVDVVSKETLVLVDNGDGWKIVHVHWSH